MPSHLLCHHSHLFTPQPTFPHLQAKVDAAKVSADWLERLSEMTKTPTSQLRFIMDAWSQVGVGGIITKVRCEEDHLKHQQANSALSSTHAVTIIYILHTQTIG